MAKDAPKGKSTFMWIAIFIILIIIVLVAVFMGTGLLDARGQFTRDEFAQQVGTPADITRSLDICATTDTVCSTSAGPDSSVIVTFTIDLGAADGYTIDETLPQGWTIESQGDFVAPLGGTYVDEQGLTHLTYAKLSNAPISLTYTAKMPSQLSSLYIFSGLFTFGSASAGKFVNETTPIGGVQTVEFDDGTIVVNLNEPSSVSLDGNLIGSGSLSQQLAFGQYTLTFGDVTGKLSIDPVTVTINPGTTTTVTCNFVNPDPADVVDSQGTSVPDGFIDSSEINSAIQEFLSGQYDQITLSNSIQNFYKGNYYPAEDQCTIA